MSDLGTGIGQVCAFCGSRDVVWSHPLADDLVAYREYGKGHTLPTSWALCDRCERIYSSGDDDGAVEVMRTSAWSWVADEDVLECVRQPLAVFRRADLGSCRFDPAPSRVAEARARDFVPLRELTGAAADLGPIWPHEHALWLDELGPAPGEDEYDAVRDRWLVRSPWPSLSARQTLNALWRRVEQDAGTTRRALGADNSLIREFFALSEAEALTFVTDEDS